MILLKLSIQILGDILEQQCSLEKGPSAVSLKSSTECELVEANERLLDTLFSWSVDECSIHQCNRSGISVEKYGGAASSMQTKYLRVRFFLSKIRSSKMWLPLSTVSQNNVGRCSSKTVTRKEILWNEGCAHELSSQLQWGRWWGLLRVQVCYTCQRNG